MANFSPLVEQLRQAGWLWQCADAAAVCQVVERLLAQPPTLPPAPAIGGPSAVIAARAVECLV
jgi:hypothetical protein